MKKIGSRIYFHKSVKAIKPPIDWPYEIVCVDGPVVSFIQCPEFDTQYEPIVGDRLVVRGETYTIRRASKTNPQIFHRRYLFVNRDYTGFDIEDDKAHVRVWEAKSPDKRRMGRFLWWRDWYAKFVGCGTMKGKD